VQRVLILGRGGAGKSTAARRLGAITGLPVTELDAHFWQPDLSPTPTEEWSAFQRSLAASERWIIDGDLGAHDVLAPRLERADTVLLLDLSFARCAWRAARRSRERLDFWWWLLTWRVTQRRTILEAIARYAPDAELRVLRTPDDISRFLSGAGSRPG
jgi:adenylate kinase family enzyme